MENNLKIIAEKFAGTNINPYLCNRLRKARAFSSAGLEHLPYKQRVGGSNPSTPTGVFPRGSVFGQTAGIFFCPYVNLNHLFRIHILLKKSVIRTLYMHYKSFEQLIINTLLVNAFPISLKSILTTAQDNLTRRLTGRFTATQLEDIVPVIEQTLDVKIKVEEP